MVEVQFITCHCSILLIYKTKVTGMKVIYEKKKKLQNILIFWPFK